MLKVCCGVGVASGWRSGGRAGAEKRAEAMPRPLGSGSVGDLVVQVLGGDL